MSSQHIIDVVFIENVATNSSRNMSTVWPCQLMPAEHWWPHCWKTLSYWNTWPWLSTLHLLSMDDMVCVTVGLSNAFSWTPHNTSTHGENKLRTKWPKHITHCSILSRGHTFYPQQRKEKRREKKHSVAQHLEKQAGELLGRRDCHVCINRHWFFCPVPAPQPFILSLLVAAQRDWRNSVTVQLGPWGLCVRIDFTCKRGEGLEPLNKGRLCHQRAGWVKSPWMDNDTYCGKRGRIRDTERWNKRKGRNDWNWGKRSERERRCWRWWVTRVERVKENKKNKTYEGLQY